MTTSERVLTLVILVWAIFIAFYLFVIVPAGSAEPVEVGEAAPIWGTDDMVCGVWTYYAPGVAERAQAIHGVPACAECTGLAVTVDQSLLGLYIEIRHGGQWHGPFLVVDVGTGRHRPHLVGEVGFETAVAWRIGRPWWTCYRRVS